MGRKPKVSLWCTTSSMRLSQPSLCSVPATSWPWTNEVRLVLISCDRVHVTICGQGVPIFQNILITDRKSYLIFIGAIAELNHACMAVSGAAVTQHYI